MTADASPAPHPAPAPSRAAPPAPAGGGAKETIEQILVAFILAFIFRCFIVEAFVIPTGSMAPTLLGAHVGFRCNDCGWRWTVNYSSAVAGDDSVPSVANEAIPARCPNCGYKVPRDSASDPENVATRPPVRFGDRILVQKYVYLLHDPDRWDVVVFKSPADDSVDPRTGVEPYTQNYIKRLVGKPGETIMILDGDVYVADAKKPLEDLKPDDFAVQTKPYKAQQALWRIVYDADHQPRGLSREYKARRQVADPSAPDGVRVEAFTEWDDDAWREPWTSGDKRWTRGERRSFVFDGGGGGGDGADGAKLSFDPTVGIGRHPLTDWLAYDVTHAVRKDANGRFSDSFTEGGYVPQRGDPLNAVSDLKLEATYRRLDGSKTGALRLNLTKQGHRFTAELGADKVRLLMTPSDGTAAVELASAAWSPGTSPHAVEFANVDYRASVRIDGREVLASTPAQFKPDVAALLADFEAKRPQEPASVWLDADGHKCAVRHLSLWRDVYYLNRDWGNSNYIWAMPDDFPTGSSFGRPIRLGADEYFVLGDNSMMSADARVWTYPIRLPDERLDVAAGRVPGRFLLGRAFFVYWPAGFSPINGLPAFAPNFGEMRFIH